MKLRYLLSALLATLLLCTLAHAQMKNFEHPFLLWTKEEAAQIKKRIDTDPVAQKQLEIMIARDSRPVGKGGQGNPNLLNLFKYTVLGDEKAGASEKAELLKFIGKVPEPMTDEFKASWAARIKEAGSEDATWQRGMASFADRHMRDEQTLNALRYDCLYNILSDEERAGVEKSMRAYIQFHLDGHKPWHPDFKYTKAGWLPNMSWPRAIGTHVMAAALKDEKLIAAMFNGVGGFKWYMDEYVSDGYFYCEEFNKYYSNIGTMLIWCESMENLGLPQYGYGYTGKNGASMGNFLQMPIRIGYPKTDLPGGMPTYRIVTMGDAKGSPFGLAGLGDNSSVTGYLPVSGKTEGNPWWQNSNMNGPFVKWREPMWFEVGQKRFPNAGFGYFLAAMRKPGEDVYLPSLYFNLGAIDPKKQKAPPAPSYFAFQRGFAFLRADESPAYWDSPAPAVAMQTGFYYPHYAHDSFSLLGYQAFNRAIYVNMGGGEVKHYVLDQIKNGPPTGYVGRHPWKDTNRGHAGVTVDNLGPRPTENGEEGLKNHTIRSAFSPEVKFAAARTKNVFPNVTQERGLFLTREYLLDVFWLADADGKSRRYEWNVNGAGTWQPNSAFAASSELNGSMLYRPLEGEDSKQPAGYENKTDGNDLRNVTKLATDGNWSAKILQTCALDDVNKSKLGKAFYDRAIGVVISMLPEKKTTIYLGTPPGLDSELGGAAIIVRREEPATTFVALHEPYENNKPRGLTASRIQQTENAVAVRVTGEGVNDRVLMTYSDKQPESVTLSDGTESFTFGSHAFVRITPAAVQITGQLTSLKLKVTGSPKLIIDGKETPATINGGVLTYTK